MPHDNLSGFGPDFGEASHESVKAQFTDGNICGAGASGAVYSMRHDGLRVAVKRLSDDLSLNAAYVSSYRKEFEIGRKLKHDALPVYRDFVVEPGGVYIVMDYVDGVTVENFIATDRGRAYFSTMDNLQRFLRQSLDALGYLHRSGVVHCDLKPSNIMLRHSDRGVMLIDLDKAYSDTYDLTHGGTPGMSAAVSEGEKPEAAKDFAALGRVLDMICEAVDKRVPRKLRGFRKLCDTPEVTVERLQRSLHASSAAPKAILVAVACFALAVVGWRFFPAAERVTAHEGDEIAGSLVADTARKDEAVMAQATAPRPRQMPASVPAAATDGVVEKKADGVDFDRSMAKYLKEVAKATTALRAGNLTDSEIQVLATRVTDIYASSYNEIIEDFKKMHPDASDSEVYLAVTTALGSSNTLRAMQSFSKELLDTVNARSATAETLHMMQQ